MNWSKPIQVFEYDTLYIGSNNGFKKLHWQALSEYNEIHGGRYFALTANGVRFQNFVGVIQAGDLTIEILPKIGRVAETPESKGKWQEILIDMLRECNWMRVFAHEKASLRYKFNSILEAYLEIYVNACEDLLRRGLIRKYRQESGNVTALKGKLRFAENIRKNLIHQERFFTTHQLYDRNNIFNQILAKALKLIPVISHSPLLKDRVATLLLDFPETEGIKVNHILFQKLVYDRKTQSYQEAIEIAAMILLNYRPDVSGGQNNILAILFDMNELWEEYVYRQLIRHHPKGWSIVPQAYKIIWDKSGTSTSKGVKPDIVIKTGGKTLIIDTKWKLPDDNIPADADLKQMFVYNEYWPSANSVLLYPQMHQDICFNDGYFRSLSADKGSISYRHGCSVMKASILDARNSLATDFGRSVINQITQKQLL